MKTAILGAGAIGRLINHKANPQHLWPFVDSRNKSFNISVFKSIDGDKQSLSSPFISNLGNIDLLIVTVKAYQVTQALQPLLATLKQNACILLLHNGMGSHLEVAPLLTKQQTLLLGTTNQGALLKDNLLCQTGLGDTFIGHYSGPKLESLQRQWLCQQLDAKWQDNIQQSLWNKLAINCAINPLTAIHNVTNGSLAEPQFYEQIEAICYEVCQVANKEGIELHISHTLKAVLNVINLTASNSSSMRQDILYQRRTEIDYINQYICQQAARHHIAVPTNQSIVDKIRALSGSM